jgi:hypothetical protein
VDTDSRCSSCRRWLRSPATDAPFCALVAMAQPESPWPAVLSASQAAALYAGGQVAWDYRHGVRADCPAYVEKPVHPTDRESSAEHRGTP